MPFSTYTELKAKVASDYKRDDLTAEIVDAIALAEAEMQIECKIIELESDASITITSGSGPLPTGFLGMRSCYWDGDTKTPLKYITPDGFDSLRNNSGDTPAYYTISGTTIRVNEGASGTLKAMCNVRFTPLSGSQASNDILAYFPNAYLYGALKHLAIVTQDDASLQKYGVLFNAAMGSIKANNKDRKYAGPLQVRPR
jgi:hypothetical protein